jgi:hypothetical protein
VVHHQARLKWNLAWSGDRAVPIFEGIQSRTVSRFSFDLTSGESLRLN